MFHAISSILFISQSRGNQSSRMFRNSFKITLKSTSDGKQSYPWFLFYQFYYLNSSMIRHPLEYSFELFRFFHILIIQLFNNLF